MNDFISALRQRVLVLDGAMGTMIQRLSLTEEDFRGDRFADSSVKLKGCNDLLCLTCPEAVAGIHRSYIEAGADIIETDTFNANAVSLAEYGLSDLAAEINTAGARVARQEADRAAAEGRKVFVAGSMGPGNVSLSMPQDADGPQVGFDYMAGAYRVQAKALIEGGVDILLLETIFDTLNAKAAVYGIHAAIRETGKETPLMLSVTLTENGRTLSGQTLDAFVASMMHSGAVSVGLNCGFGAGDMAPYVAALQKYGFYISLHPNAGLPDEMGRYVETPEKMAAVMGRYLADGMLNIAGGCCGTTPEHIRAIADVARRSPRRIPPVSAPDNDPGTMLLSSLVQTSVSPQTGFVKIGERCNVAGSRKFLRLIDSGAYAEAIETAAAQMEKGAEVLDINMDDGMLDADREMTRFVCMLGLDGNTSEAPLMIDSSDFGVIVNALKHIQGRPVVNSISLKEGEEIFLDHARTLRDLGAVTVVMAFDEKGQATTFGRRVEICSRAYKLLTQKAGYRGCDIVFDPNILTVATGMPEHDRYALDFIETVGWIKSNLPGAKVSGGVSNLSFAFRGNNPLREAMHTVFLHHAIERGLDMAIVNPSTKTDISTVEPALRESVEDVILCRRPDATHRLTEIASVMKEEQERLKALKAGSPAPAKKSAPAGSAVSLADMVVRGIDTGLVPRLEEALREEGSALGVIKNRLMEGMNRVGDAFGAGRMFLPQVVRSAGIMKQAVAWLTPYIESESRASDNGSQNEVAPHSGRMVLATVKGDVHDIGKNIVAVIMRCAGFGVIDLGVMVEPEKILAAARDNNADIIALSGLITPSLAEMSRVAEMMEAEGMTGIPLFVGGATTSPLHTAVKIAPLFSGLVVHTRDAAAIPDIATALLDPSGRDQVAASVRASQADLRERYAAKNRTAANPAAGPDKDSAPAAGLKKDLAPTPAPVKYGEHNILFSPVELLPLINVREFLHVWQLPVSAAETTRAVIDERERLLNDARKLIEKLDSQGVRIQARVNFVHARREDENIVIVSDDVSGNSRCDCGCIHGQSSGTPVEVVLPTLRSGKNPKLAMADFVARNGDTIALFAVTVGDRIGNMIKESENDDYSSLLLQSVADRLVEAATEKLHTIVHEDLWQLKDRKRGIRPAVGYPSLPDQTLVFELDRILNYKNMGIHLTENGALWPTATTTGLMIASEGARYFEVGHLSDAALRDYARRRNISEDRARDLLPS